MAWSVPDDGTAAIASPDHRGNWRASRAPTREASVNTSSGCILARAINGAGSNPSSAPCHHGCAGAHGEERQTCLGPGPPADGRVAGERADRRLERHEDSGDGPEPTAAARPAP